MWVYGSEALLSQTDEEFRNNSYQAMVFATALAIVLASCIGFLFARTLVSPINRMTTTAKAIKEGDLSAAPSCTARTRSRTWARRSMRWPTPSSATASWSAV